MSIQNNPKMELADRLALAVNRAVARKSADADTPLDAPATASAVGNVVEMRDGVSAQSGARKDVRWPLPGLAPMTRVRTDFGDVHSIALRKGDYVLTRSGEFQPIVWIKRIRLDAHVLETKHDSNPIVIPAKCLGNSAEIAFSPRQVITEIPGGALTEPCEAADLLALSGVKRVKETSLTYTMFHLGRRAEVYCEGLFLEIPIEV